MEVEEPDDPVAVALSQQGLDLVEREVARGYFSDRLRLAIARVGA